MKKLIWCWFYFFFWKVLRTVPGWIPIQISTREYLIFLLFFDFPRIFIPLGSIWNTHWILPLAENSVWRILKIHQIVSPAALMPMSHNWARGLVVSYCDLECGKLAGQLFGPDDEIRPTADGIKRNKARRWPVREQERHQI